MKRSRFSEEQSIAMLKEQEAGATVGDICRRKEVSGMMLFLLRSRGHPDTARLSLLSDA